MAKPGRGVVSPTVFRKIPGRLNTQWTALSMAACSSSGSYQGAPFGRGGQFEVGLRLVCQAVALGWIPGIGWGRVPQGCDASAGPSAVRRNAAAQAVMGGVVTPPLSNGGR